MESSFAANDCLAFVSGNVGINDEEETFRTYQSCISCSAAIGLHLMTQAASVKCTISSSPCGEKIAQNSCQVLSNRSALTACEQNRTKFHKVLKVIVHFQYFVKNVDVKI